MQTKADNQAEIERVIEVFHRKKPINYTLQEIRQEESDSRWVLLFPLPKRGSLSRLQPMDSPPNSGWRDGIR